MLGIHRITPGVRIVLTLVVMGWLWSALGPLMVSGEWLADIPDAIRQGQVWRLFSYPFAGSLSIGSLISALCFTTFAVSVEETLGTTRFWRLFWGSTLVAGLLGLAISFATPGPVLYGLTVPGLAAFTFFCLTQWESNVYVWMFPIKAKYLVAIAVLFILASQPVLWPPTFSAMALAYLMAKHNWLMRTKMFSKEPARRRRSRLSDDFSGPKVTPIRSNLQKAALSETEVQVDRILDKLRSEGMASLTPHEKEVLDSQSKRLRHGDERM